QDTEKAVLVDTKRVPSTAHTLTVQPSTDYEKSPLFGNIHYKLDYDFGSNKLAVTIFECRQLPAMDRNGMSDPYVKFTELQCMTLQLIVYDFDRLRKDDRIGQLSIPLERVDFGTTVEVWSQLSPPEEGADSESRLGDVCFSLRYRPATATLTVAIMEARNLKKMDVTGSSG
ncbi:unnamed protein product, partial [Gongylonema pulchrum]|uniref:C2 domain-containing protein n=1 Tax=Gongylonema pulchrum TaxID=637853 RepID=A0A183E899_9BILA